LHLPRIVRDAPNGSAFFSKDKNMLLVERLSGLAGPYAVFFNVKASTHASIDVVMFVASAYEKPLLPNALPAVPFTALIAKASKGAHAVQTKEIDKVVKRNSPRLAGAMRETPFAFARREAP
jgi:hypothetical protein